MRSGLTRHTWCCVLLTTLSAMLMGYDVGVMSSAILFIKLDMGLSVLREEMIVGSLNLVAAGAALCAGFFANRFGRRLTLGFAAAVFFAGAAALAAARGFACLMAGRVLTGVGVGFAMMIAPLYSAEISPARARGFLVSFTEIFVDLGILLGYLIGFAFQFLSPSFNWRLMLGAGALPALVLALGTLFVLPESPRWLAMRGRYTEAMEVLDRTSHATSGGREHETKRRLEEIVAANELERSIGEGEWSNLNLSSLARLVKSPSFLALAKLYTVAIGVNFFQQAAGIEATVYYSPAVFKAAGVSSQLGMLGTTLGVGFVKLSFVLVATFTLDHVGRKKLLLLSSAGMLVCLAVVCAAFLVFGINATSPAAARFPLQGALVIVLAVCGYVAFFSMGWGPIAYVVSSEIFPPRHRSKALGLSMFVNRIVSRTWPRASINPLPHQS